MKKTQADYDQAYRERAGAAGMRRVTVMVPENQVQYIRHLAGVLRNGSGTTNGGPAGGGRGSPA